MERISLVDKLSSSSKTLESSFSMMERNLKSRDNPIEVFNLGDSMLRRQLDRMNNRYLSERDSLSQDDQLKVDKFMKDIRRIYADFNDFHGEDSEFDHLVMKQFQVRIERARNKIDYSPVEN